MEFSFDWICQYVDPEESAAEVADRLTAAGLAVEGQESRGSDTLFDVDVTTNRPDCMNHFGMAREVAALVSKPLKQPSVAIDEIDEQTSDVARVEIEDSVGCPRYVARVVKGVQVGPSPEWLVERLESIGQRPINNVVDITNFVLWELGQPIHAFDLDKVTESTIVVRRARANEKLTTLDGEERELDPEVLVIADRERVVALAGIMGGLDSEVSPSTVDVLIESAHFDPTRVRLGAGALSMHTDANHRFERGADPGICRRAADRVASLIAEIAGGEVLAGAIDAQAPSFNWQLEGTLDLARAERFGGVELGASQVQDQLQAIGFELEPTGDEVWKVKVPTWRYYDMKPDSSLPAGASQPPVYEADLFEEVLRLHGFDDIPATLPNVSGPDAGSSAGHWRREGLRRYLAACGYTEAVTFAFHDTDSDERYPAIERHGGPLNLANPLSELYTVMRRSILPGLVDAAEFNLRRGADSVRLFEVGHLFPGGDAEEVESLAIVAGGGIGTPWDRQLEFDLFDLKGAVEGLAARSGLDLRFQPTNLPGFVDGTAASIAIADAESSDIGFLGQLSRDDTSFPLFAAEIRTAQFEVGEVPRVVLPSRFPGVEMDLTLTHSSDISWAELRQEILEADIEDLAQLGLKVRYSGEGVPSGAVNTTIYFLYNSADRSLTQDEVNARHEAVRQRLTDRFGWKGSN